VHEMELQKDTNLSAAIRKATKVLREDGYVLAFAVIFEQEGDQTILSCGWGSAVINAMEDGRLDAVQEVVNRIQEAVSPEAIAAFAAANKSDQEGSSDS
jgi:hypothetical protein